MRDRTILLTAAIDCIDKCIFYTKGMGIDEFLSDSKTQDAVVRNLEIIGQVVKDFGVDDLILDHPGFRWKEISGMRNIIPHEYLDVDLNVIWSALTQNLIPLKVVLLEIKRDMNNAKRL